VNITPLSELSDINIANYTKALIGDAYDTRKTGNERNEYIHDELLLEKTLPYYSSQTNAVKNDVYVNPYIDNNVELERNTPFTSYSTNSGTSQTNFNINSRLQWRFRPMSDIYIVYTDNYNTLAPTYSPNPYLFLGAKNKAIVVKIVWWLNI
jgi:hypothetical protein